MDTSYVSRYAAHCDVRIVRTSHAMARELTVTRLPHTASVTSVRGGLNVGTPWSEYVSSASCSNE